MHQGAELDVFSIIKRSIVQPNPRTRVRRFCDDWLRVRMRRLISQAASENGEGMALFLRFFREPLVDKL